VNVARRVVDTHTLKLAVKGAVVLPDDSTYDAVRAVWNAMVDKRPAAIVRCADEADVVATLGFARERGLPITVRGGGHHIAGTSVCDGGVVIDLSTLKGVRVDAVARRAVVQPGALLADVDAATLAHGLATPLGVNSTTGIAGLTLGGGFGWLTRQHGMTIDNLVSVRIVGADGVVRRASADEHRDLFWAIRGGGGNFGVVTSFTFQCHPVGPMVGFAGVFHPVEDAENVYRQFRDWAKTAPDEISAFIGCTTLPASEHTPPEIHNTPFIVTGAVFSGDPEVGMKIIQPLRDIGTPLADISGPIPFVGVQAAFDEFYRNGFQGSSLNRIVEEAGTTKGALFHHFEGKSDLGYAVVRELIHPRLKTRWSDPLAQTTDPITEVKRRVVGTTTWETTRAAFGSSLFDSTVVPGQRYEYHLNSRIQNVVTGMPDDYGTYIKASLKGTPIHNPGKIILLVDQALTNFIQTELSGFITNLIGDGWQVLRVARSMET